MSTDSTTPEVITLDLRTLTDVQRLRDVFRAKDVLPGDAISDWRDALVEYAKPPLPEEPSLWTLVRLGNGRIALREDECETGWADYWVHEETTRASAGAMTWPEVCALGTPEVLEPETVKALRGRVTDLQAEYGKREASQDTIRERLTAERDRAWAALKQVRDFASTLREQYEASDYSESIPLGQVADSLEGLLTLAGYAVKPQVGEDEPAEPAPVGAVVAKEPQEKGAQVKDCDGDVWERSETGLWFRPASPTSFRHPWHTVEQYGPLTLVEPSAGESA